MSEQVETVIIGAGQAGLATAYHLRRRGVPVLVLEGRARVGDVWRERYDSLQLFSPAQGDGLPGMAFPAPRGTYPTGAAMGDFLAGYAAAMDLPVRLGVHVERVLARQGGFVVITDDGGSIDAAQVVVATGAHKRPHVPGFAADLDPGIVQIHSAGYRNPAQLQDGPVLVVGASHSGADLALEVAATHRTVLSGRIRGEVPYTLGRPSARVANVVVPIVFQHLLTLRTPIGRKIAPAVRRGGAAPLIRVKRRHLAEAGVELTPARTVGTRDGLPLLDDGRVLDVRNVLWCTGYREDFRWVEPAPLDETGYPCHHRGVVDGVPGLYFAGLPFQFAYASMLILGAGRDAEHVARHIAAHRRTTAETAPVLR
ncbi:flavin-containing monooxygenase [Georgenia thermotolerans]|uniref:FAD-dependent oxidoreductase n=1 Tax=Georgenia thermotolerans TaxID=527326 RepID=A0A7J5UPX7_9MICO|nr:NAD(P)/FAD-dependent oxidoreductase [Georgenia thermotolerans]KAE8764462.1 FAD-dependent oxidoreductase [Georgenia thermotolerans]